MTLIKKGIAEEVGLKMKLEKMRIRTMTGVTEHEVGILDIPVSSTEKGDDFVLADTVVIDKLELSCEDEGSQEVVSSNRS